MPKIKVAIVDDDPVIVRLVTMLLQARNYDIMTASDGTTGLSMVKNKLPDIILLDVNMPDISGFEVCYELRADKKTKKIPIIIFTTEEGSETVVNAKQVTADDYIVKPFSLQMLLNKMIKLLAKNKR